jgi:hypothetical protein
LNLVKQSGSFCKGVEGRFNFFSPQNLRYAPNAPIGTTNKYPNSPGRKVIRRAIALVTLRAGRMHFCGAAGRPFHLWSGIAIKIHAPMSSVSITAGRYRQWVVANRLKVPLALAVPAFSGPQEKHTMHPLSPLPQLPQRCEAHAQSFVLRTCSRMRSQCRALIDAGRHVAAAGRARGPKVMAPWSRPVRRETAVMKIFDRMERGGAARHPPERTGARYRRGAPGKCTAYLRRRWPGAAGGMVGGVPPVRFDFAYGPLSRGC